MAEVFRVVKDQFSGLHFAQSPLQSGNDFLKLVLSPLDLAQMSQDFGSWPLDRITVGLDDLRNPVGLCSGLDG